VKGDDEGGSFPPTRGREKKERKEPSTQSRKKRKKDLI